MLKMANYTIKNDLIVNDLIKIIYKNDNGKTVKNALVSKSQCDVYKQIDILKKNKTKKVNSSINNNQHNKNNNKTLKNSKKLKDMTIKCFTKKNKINKQPKIIISDTDTYNNNEHSFLVVIISNVFVSFKHKQKKDINNKDKHLTWVGIINDDKVVKNIVKHSLNKEKGLHNFVIRIYKFPKNNSDIIDKINNFVTTKKNIVVKKLKTIKDLERIYTNNIIMIRKSNHYYKWWKYDMGFDMGISFLNVLLH
jgi:hypothetical protein